MRLAGVFELRCELRESRAVEAIETPRVPIVVRKLIGGAPGRRGVSDSLRMVSAGLERELP